MCVYWRTNFQVSSIIVTSFRTPQPQSRPTAKRTPKKLTQIRRQGFNLSEEEFYGSYKKFSYIVSHWVEAEALKIGKYIYHRMYGQGGEHRAKIWTLNHKSEKKSRKFDLNILMKYLMKEISFNKRYDCHEDVLTVEQENNYKFLTTSKVKFLYIKGSMGPLLYSFSFMNIF